MNASPTGRLADAQPQIQELPRPQTPEVKRLRAAWHKRLLQQAAGAYDTAFYGGGQPNILRQAYQQRQAYLEGQRQILRAIFRAFPR